MTTAPTTPSRNPGPSWGYAFIVGVARLLPRRLFQALLWLGSAIGWAVMPAQRQSSRHYLGLVLGRAPRRREQIEHFYRFMALLVELLEVGRGKQPGIAFAAEGDAEAQGLARRGEQALYGTFHLGHSDLMGYLLSDHNVTLHMLRLRRENSRETDWLGSRFERWVHFLWIDRPEEMLFAVKNALESGASLALKCDRPEQAVKLSRFPFLGSERAFPMTIYHFACLFDLPVAFMFGVRNADGGIDVVAAPLFRPPKGQPRQAALQAAHAHFQGVLALVERLLQRDPYAWFNFGPWNPNP